MKKLDRIKAVQACLQRFRMKMGLVRGPNFDRSAQNVAAQAAFEIQEIEKELRDVIAANEMDEVVAPKVSPEPPRKDRARKRVKR